jgi:hypothetical protein
MQQSMFGFTIMQHHLSTRTLLMYFPFVTRWVALPEDAQEEAAAATGFQPTAADGLQSLEMYGKQLAHTSSNKT